MTHHPDPTAVLTAALRRAVNNYPVSPWGPWPDRKDAETLADAYLALTDPTPLSVEVLVEMGGIENPKSELCYKFGKLCVYADGPPEAWEWTYGNDGIHDVPPWLNPRTAGELMWLLRRLEK